MALLTLLWLLCVATTRATFTLSDLQYPMPTCTVRGTGVTNSFGQLTLQPDLLGRQLTLGLALDPSQSSCRFCAYSPAFCTTPYGNSSSLHLARDTSFNVKLMTLTPQNATLVANFRLPQGVTQLGVDATSLLPYDKRDDASLCGNHYRLVVLLLITAEAPALRDFLAIAGDDQTMASVPCSADVGLSQSDLSCRLAPRFFYLDVALSNCIRSLPATASPPAPTQSYSIVYWRAHPEAWPPLTPSLCDETWPSLLERLHPEDYLCDTQNALYIRPLPFYDAAMTAIATWLNAGGATADGDVLWLLDTLERHCGASQTGTVSLEQTILANASARLRARLQSPSDVDCEALTPSRDIALPYYVAHFDEWQMHAFKYVVYFDEAMPIKSALLLSLIIIAALLATLLMVGAGCRLFLRHRRELKAYARVV